MIKSVLKNSVVRRFLVFVSIVIAAAALSSDFLRIKHDLSFLYSINKYFWAVFIQAFPFVMGGAFISAYISRINSGDAKRKWFDNFIKRNRLAPFVVSVLFPSCDCSSSVIFAGMLKNGVPFSSSITYYLVAPLLNPIVILSTFFAFPGDVKMIVSRIFIGIIISILVPLILCRIFRDGSKVLIEQHKEEHSYHEEGCSCGCSHHSVKESIFISAGRELIHVLPFVIGGIIASSVFQTFFPKEAFSFSKAGSVLIIQTLMMMAAAFTLSVCATSDAFIAASFRGFLSSGSILGFLLLGPMIDVKNVIVLSSYFKKRFVILLTIIVFIVTFILSIAFSYLIFR